MREIPLTKGYVALVDDQDYEWLVTFRWQVMSHDGIYYARRTLSRRESKPGTVVLMHREILGLSQHAITDHINGNGLDNRRSNLRQCTHQQNSWNNRGQINKSSVFKGVSWHSQKRKWRSRIMLNGREKHLGLFRSEVAAAKAYKDAALGLFGHFAAGVRGDRLDTSPVKWPFRRAWGEGRNNG